MDTFIKINLAFLGFVCMVGYSVLLVMAMNASRKILQKHMSSRTATIIVCGVTLELIAFAISFLTSL